MSRRKQAKPQHFQSDPEVASLPRRDGECSGPRRGHTHAHTRTRTHTHAHPDPRTRGWPPRPPPLHRRRVSARLFGSACFSFSFFFFFLNFNLPLLGFPLARGKETLLPAGSFRSRWDLQGEERGHAGLAPAPCFSGERSPGPAESGQGPGCAAGCGCGQRPSAPAGAGFLALPARHPGPRAGLCRPGPAAGCGKEVYLALRAELRAWGSCLCRSVPMIALHLGQRRGMVCLWGFKAARRWGPVSGRRRLARCGRGRGGDYSWRLVAPETVRAGRVWLPKFIPAPFLPTQAVTPCPQKPLDSVCATENRGTPYES